MTAIVSGSGLLPIARDAMPRASQSVSNCAGVSRAHVCVCGHAGAYALCVCVRGVILH
jgi:hypothetical protein